MQNSGVNSVSKGASSILVDFFFDGSPMICKGSLYRPVRSPKDSLTRSLDTSITCRNMSDQLASD